MQGFRRTQLAFFTALAFLIAIPDESFGKVSYKQAISKVDDIENNRIPGFQLQVGVVVPENVSVYQVSRGDFQGAEYVKGRRFVKINSYIIEIDRERRIKVFMTRREFRRWLSSFSPSGTE